MVRNELIKSHESLALNGKSFYWASHFLSANMAHDAARLSLVLVSKYKLTRSCVMCVCVILCECFGRLNNDSSPRIAPPAVCCCVLVLCAH